LQLPAQTFSNPQQSDKIGNKNCKQCYAKPKKCFKNKLNLKKLETWGRAQRESASAGSLIGRKFRELKFPWYKVT